MLEVGTSLLWTGDTLHDRPYRIGYVKEFVNKQTVTLQYVEWSITKCDYPVKSIQRYLQSFWTYDCALTCLLYDIAPKKTL